MSTHQTEKNDSTIVHLSSRKFFLGCLITAILILIIGSRINIPDWVLAAEVLGTVVALFLFGSIRYRLDKNALTYSAAMIIAATFWSIWWESSSLRMQVHAEGISAWVPVAKHYLLSLHGWDELVHADTMLFILGLTFFVSVVAQSRLLEKITFVLLRRNRGWVLPTVITVTAVVSIASGILDGVSMIGLTIRTLVIILLLASAPIASIRYAVMVCTAVTTVCGIWLAYGEPPNLIMKSNLHPHLSNSFFLRYCAPAAVAAYLVVAFNMRRKIRGIRVPLEELDLLSSQAALVRFLQAERHGNVLSAIEFIEDHTDEVGDKTEPVLERLRRGQPLGEALVRENVKETTRRFLLGKFVSEDIAQEIDRYYVEAVAGNKENAKDAERSVEQVMRKLRPKLNFAQWMGGIALIPFIGMLIWHAIDHSVPLFYASFAGFAVAFLGIIKIHNVRKLAIKDAKHEYADYFFLFPLFLSITFLVKINFFDQIQQLLNSGIEHLGQAHVAFAQFLACTVLSAILDNNVVADFGSHALHGLNLSILHLFAMAQIAGYAVGGCWTHIGSAQSVVAFAFIRRDLDEDYTPFQWIKEMTPLVLEIFVIMTILIYTENVFFGWLSQS